MKTRKLHQFILILGVLLVISGISLAVEPLTLGSDGYGKTTLPNGIILVVNQDKSTQLSAGRIVIGGGLVAETAVNNGISNLMIRMLFKGNKTMTASQITEQLDFLGAGYAAECYRDYSSISFSSLTENFDKVLEIISTSLVSPTFPADELTKLKAEVEGEIKSSNDNQGQASSNLFWKTVYGNLGYGLTYLGTNETIASITVDNLKDYYQKYVGGSNMVISVATDMPVEQVLPILEKRFGVIKPQAEKIQPPSLTMQPEKNGFISYDRNQSFVFKGYVLDRQNAKELAIINILNQVMGANVGSRLWGLRQTEKLAYNVFSQFSHSKYMTAFRSGIGTDTSKVKQALSSLDREWNRLLADGITEQEFSDAKVNMKNSLIYGIDKKSGRTNNMATYEYLGYGYKFYLDQIALADQITLAEVNSYIKAKLTPDRMYTSIVGKQ